MPVIKCPYCKSLNTELLDGKRKRDRGYIRVRACKDCGKKYTTKEIYAKPVENMLRM